MKNRAFLPQPSTKCPAVISSDFISSDLATPSRMAIDGTMMMNLDQP